MPFARRVPSGANEFRVRFSRPLKGARLAHEPAPAPAPALASPPPSPPPAPPAPTPPAPTGFIQIDASNELREDRERIEAVLGALEARADGLRTERADRLREWQRAAVELALTIAGRVLHERVEAGELAIDNKVRDMIAQLGDEAAVTVRLNPADLALLSGRLGGGPLSDEYADPKFIADPNIGRGDCQVEGRESMLVSDVTRELEEIRDELLRSLKNARS